MKTFLIAPVRGLPADAYESIVRVLTNEGYEVYWPARDTDQSDPSGLEICRANSKAIKEADVVHIIWDGQSEGCLFDLGMTFAYDKKVIPISLPKPSEGKSFQNMVRKWSDASS